MNGGWSTVPVKGDRPVLAAMLLCAALPLAPVMVPAVIVVFFLVMLWHHRPIRLRQRLPSGSPMPWMLAYYVLHIAGMVWSENKQHGYLDLEIKLSLGLFPLLFMLLPRGTSRIAAPALMSFVAANTLAVLICIAAAIHRISTGAGGGWDQQVLSSAFSLFLHPSYAAMYMCFALACVYLHPAMRIGGRWLRRVVAIILCTGIVLMASKIAWGVLALLCVHFLIAAWRDRELRIEALAGIAAAVGGVALIASVTIYASSRIDEMREVVVGEEVEATTTTSTGLRTLVWNSALLLIERHPLSGTGTGDIKDDLMQVYEQHGYTGASERRLNAHSQILQSAAALGVPGAILLLAAIVLPFVNAFRSRYHFAMAFYWITFANWSVESMLEVQAGVVFFAFFAFLVSLKDHPHPPEELLHR